MKSIKPAHGDRGATKRRSAPRRTGSNMTESQGAGNAPKRKRASQPKIASTSKKIACVSCGQGDVPLMMGGRKFPCIIYGEKLTCGRFLPTVHGCWEGKQRSDGGPTGRKHLPATQSAIESAIINPGGQRANGETDCTIAASIEFGTWCAPPLDLSTTDSTTHHFILRQQKVVI